MGIEERRERQKQQLKQAILEAALKVAAKVGWEGVTIRKIAEKIEYSPPTIYEFFDSKEHLISALAKRGFSLLLADLQAANLETGEAKPAFLKACRIYWDFAWKQPELYRVMHSITPKHDQTDMPEAQAVFSLLRDLTGKALPKTKNLDDALLAVWGLLHGLVSLTLEGRIEGGHARAKEVLEQTLTDLVQVWSN
jgi:AcrR family transcriptional regulator